MKKILELLVCLLHPVATVLVWIDLYNRDDITATSKSLWAVFAFIPVVPVIYVLFSGDLW